MQLRALVFGPGFPSAGKNLDCEVTEIGLRVETGNIDDDLALPSNYQSIAVGYFADDGGGDIPFLADL